MKVNESGLDRVIRIILAAVLLVLFLTHIVTGVLGIVLLVVAAIALITGVVGFCPAYTLFKFSTNKK